jgi:hypothetical protein
VIIVMCVWLWLSARIPVHTKHKRHWWVWVNSTINLICSWNPEWDKINTLDGNNVTSKGSHPLMIDSTIKIETK